MRRIWRSGILGGMRAPIALPMISQLHSRLWLSSLRSDEMTNSTNSTNYSWPHAALEKATHDRTA